MEPQKQKLSNRENAYVQNFGGKREMPPPSGKGKLKLSSTILMHNWKKRHPKHGLDFQFTHVPCQENTYSSLWLFVYVP